MKSIVDTMPVILTVRDDNHIKIFLYFASCTNQQLTVYILVQFYSVFSYNNNLQ